LLKGIVEVGEAVEEDGSIDVEDREGEAVFLGRGM
jgi:hypothetical protein